MKKRILALLIVLCLVAGMVPAVSASEVVASGTCGENLTWVLTEDRELVISGTGAMNDYSERYRGPWSRYSIQSVVINSGVTSIGEYAFANCGSMNSVYIPVSVTTISKYAFSECDGIHLWGDVYYAGNPEQWKAINIVPQGNLNLLDASISYNYVPNPGFSDVSEDSFYYSAVMWAVEQKITVGTSETTFSPGDSCLRAHVVTFLWRATGCPEPNTGSNHFVDVGWTDFFYKPVLWAVEKGITNGVSDTRFGSYDVCNRAAVVTFLWRAAGSPEPGSTVNPFTDVKATDFYYKAVLWAVEKGVTNGLSATEFGPNTSCNRAQVVTFLYRAYND